MKSNQEHPDIFISWPNEDFHLYKRKLSFQKKLDIKGLSSISDPMLLPIGYHALDKRTKAVSPQWKKLIHEGLGFSLLDLMVKKQLNVLHYTGEASYLNGLGTFDSELFQVEPLILRAEVKNMSARLLESIIAHPPHTDQTKSWDKALKLFVKNIFDSHRKFSHPHREFVLRMLPKNPNQASWLSIHQAETLWGIFARPIITVAPQHEQEVKSQYQEAKSLLEAYRNREPAFDRFYQSNCKKVDQIINNWKKTENHKGKRRRKNTRIAEFAR
ncbi:MAG: hypothetical protein AAF206_31910 [Bacteroidota bacterium]